MAVGWHTLKLLCEAKSRGLHLGDTVTIGRQWFSVPVAGVLRMFDEYGIALPPNVGELGDPPVYVDTVLSWLGARRIESIDCSDYEKATIVRDMNSPIPEELHEQFDFVLDSGSIEHIFNVPQALANYVNLARVGGTIMVATMANNAVGHGFYQFSPELFYRVFSPSNGCQVDRLVLHEVYMGSQFYEVPDPADLHSRVELSNAWLAVHLTVQARRTRKTELFQAWPQQSDYAQVWAGQANVSEVQPVLEQMIQNARKENKLRKVLGEKFPRLRRWKRGLGQMILDRYPSLAERRVIEQSRNWNLALRKQFTFSARPEWFRPTQ